MNGVVIRSATVADAGLVKIISAEAYPAALGFVPKRAVEDYRRRIEQGEVWLVGRDAEPCGVLVLETSVHELTIYSIAVLTHRQRLGLG